eukprot:1142309-Pelagomonas_calceolata.AAC.3
MGDSCRVSSFGHVPADQCMQHAHIGWRTTEFCFWTQWLDIACRGTHQWDRFITPEELVIMASEAGLTLSHMAGIQLQPRMPGSFALTDDTSVNYIAAFYKP